VREKKTGGKACSLKTPCENRKGRKPSDREKHKYDPGPGSKKTQLCWLKREHDVCAWKRRKDMRSNNQSGGEAGHIKTRK